MKNILRAALGSLILAAFASPLPAQKYEIHPYAGGFLTDGGVAAEFKQEGIYGVKGGFFLTDSFEIEGNFGYINHFELEGSDPESRGILWEASGSYHLPTFYKRWQPYVTAGVGGISAVVDDDSTGPGAEQVLVIEDGDTFFNFSYGGGVKAMRLWGPVGLRADARARTIPNLHGEATTWLELTGGITIAWGER